MPLALLVQDWLSHNHVSPPQPKVFPHQKFPTGMKRGKIHPDTGEPCYTLAG